MESRNLTELIASLTAEQQAAVEEFIKYLKEQCKDAPNVSFRDVLDSFVREHSELLQRLAQ